MGPIILLDKSAFQSLSRDEHVTFWAYFMQTLPPILVFEIASDLAKEVQEGASADEKVAELAAKFGGSGPAVTWDFRSMCLSSLVGNSPTMNGGIPARMAIPVPDPSGPGYGMYIDLAPENHALLRWASGEFTEEERTAAVRWREESKALSVTAFENAMRAHYVVFPRCTTIEQIGAAVDRLLETSGLQKVWLHCLLDALEASGSWREVITRRWEARGSYLDGFAPYAHFCTRCLLAFSMAKHFRLVTERPTDPVDLEYLYYAPFCMAFCSNDRLHRALAPLVLRSDQTFVLGEDLKADLRRHRRRGALTSEEGRRRAYSLGLQPVPMRDSVVCELWGKYCSPWSPGMGNQAIRLSEAERRLADQEAAQLFQAAGLTFDYKPLPQ